MNRKNMLAIATLLIAVMAVASIVYAPPNKPLKGVYVILSGGDVVNLDPNTLVEVTRNNIGFHTSWVSNQYPGDKYIVYPTTGSSGITFVNSKDLSVACRTNYGSNWLEVSPDGTFISSILRSADEVSTWPADPTALNCDGTDVPLDAAVYDTSLHDGPCDSTITSDGAWNWIPDISSFAHGFDTYTGVHIATQSTSIDDTILVLDRCKDGNSIRPFMTTVSQDPSYPYVFGENLESVGSSRSQSVLDISDPYNPVEVVRFVDDPTDCTNAVLGGDGEYRLPGGTMVRGGYIAGATTDEFTPGAWNGDKYNFMFSGRYVLVASLKNLQIIDAIDLGAGASSNNGDFSKDGKTLFVNTANLGKVCAIDVETAVDGDSSNNIVTCSADLGARTRAVVVK